MSGSKREKRGKTRKPVFQSEFKEDLKYWIDTNWAIAYRALKLVDEIIHRDPFTGTGKPEPLKGLSNTWSRRLTQEHVFEIPFNGSGLPVPVKGSRCIISFTMFRALCAIAQFVSIQYFKSSLNSG